MQPRPRFFHWGDLPLVACEVFGVAFLVLACRSLETLPIRAVLLVLGLVLLSSITWIFVARWKLFRSISFTTRHGVHVVVRDGQVIDPAAIESFTDWLVNKWLAKTERWKPIHFLEALSGTIIIWESCPGHDGVCENHHGPRGDFEDLVHPKEKLIRVCYHNKLKIDALAHAIGHIFLRNLMYLSSEKEQDKFMKEKDLP